MYESQIFPKNSRNKFGLFEILKIKIQEKWLSVGIQVDFSALIKVVDINSMKVEVTLFTAGQIHKEVVQATDYQSAKRTAQARNPEATIVSVTAVF